MAKQKSCHKYIYKIHSKRLKKDKWKLKLPLNTALDNKEDVVALNDSQILRWICRLNGIDNLDKEVSNLKHEIKLIKKMPTTTENKKRIKELYCKLYSLQYQKDYVNIIMDTKGDYDRCNKGFLINDTKYRRLLGTNGGIKKSTITYVNEKIYDEIKKRMDNGRKMDKKIMASKLEAYQAFICSGSIPIPKPRFIIVNDCYTKFKEDVYTIQDGKNSVEPVLEEVNNYEIEYCDSDGYGLMTPEFSKKVNACLYGEDYADKTISGVNTRYAWTKGMLFTFDFVKFAELKNNNSYIVKDAWGTERDVREYDAILTTSMVKLWDFYDSLEDYIKCCDENEYDFAIAKSMPHELENSRNANYQFLQDYDFTDEDIVELCKPTIDEIKDVLSKDWRKTITYLNGKNFNAKFLPYLENNFTKGIMIDKTLLHDKFIVKKIYNMIRKRIEMACKGSIMLDGNFAIVCGDPYSLCQSIFNIKEWDKQFKSNITGLLKAGEVYHKYWIDKDIDEILLFRAPMTCRNNIRKRKVVTNEDMDFWYQYITTGIILNSWDTTCDALNGADKDSDTFFSTCNKVMLRRTNNDKTIQCMQRKAEKIIPTEKDIIEANKLAFGDEIGSITNKVTSMIEIRSKFSKDSEQYKVLTYRIMCGQHFQQNAIDKAKGIVAEPMPKYWYDRNACLQLPEDTEDQKHFKEICIDIVADKKPYFMKYVYPELKRDYNNYVKDTNRKSLREFKKSFEELLNTEILTEREIEFLEYQKTFLNVGDNPCSVNKISWLFEKNFNDILRKEFSDKNNGYDFDFNKLKSDTEYSKSNFTKIVKLKEEYMEFNRTFMKTKCKEKIDTREEFDSYLNSIDNFKKKCYEICPNHKELCNIIIDICYKTDKSKQFAWDICGDVIINNLLKINNNIINYPIRIAYSDSNDNDYFKFYGDIFTICQYKVENMEEEDI